MDIGAVRPGRAGRCGHSSISPLMHRWVSLTDKETTMATCAMCGNDYDKTFEIVRGDSRAAYDSFECAIHAEAPTCAHCGCRILGHGVETENALYCCAHCARVHNDADQLQDRA